MHHFDTGLSCAGIVLAAAMGLSQCAQAAESAAAPADADSLAKQLANPVAALISVPLQLNWDTGLAADGLGQKWLLNIQPVIPVSLNDKWNLISRTILPLQALSNVVPGDNHQSGLGDITQSLFFSPKEPIGGWIIGAGPALLIPTATDSALGLGKWGLGPTVVALKQSPDGWTVGALWNHIWSFAGQKDRSAVNATFIQPFISKGLGKGITVSANFEASYDYEGSSWVVPLNLTTSKVTKIGSQLVSIGGGVRYYAESPAGGPDWGLRLFLTLLYPK
jgi:Putative MetA-pathway of phenol degradation